MLFDHAYDLFRAIRAEHRMRQAHSKDLIRTNAGVRRPAVDNVIQVTALFIPQQAIEAPLGEGGHAVVALPPWFVTDAPSKLLHDADCVVPERLDFDRLAAARRHNPIANLCVHPRQLNASLTGIE